MSGFGDVDMSGPPKGVDDTTDYAGTELRVTWGKEHLQPLRFQGMDIGPFEMGVVVHEGETPLQAKRRAMKHLNAMAQDEIDEKLPAFKKLCAQAAGDM